MIKSFDQFKKEQVNEGFWDWLTGKSETGDAPKTKADTKKEGPVDDKVAEYYKTLQTYADSKQSVTVSADTEKAFSKMVQDIQIALDFLGYKMPKYGWDGYFGPETAAAIDKFNTENSPKKDEAPAEKEEEVGKEV